MGKSETQHQFIPNHPPLIKRRPPLIPTHPPLIKISKSSFYLHSCILNIKPRKHNPAEESFTRNEKYGGDIRTRNTKFTNDVTNKLITFIFCHLRPPLYSNTPPLIKISKSSFYLHSCILNIKPRKHNPAEDSCSRY